jgi:hypothetical protein
MSRLGMSVSDTTILRSIKEADQPKARHAPVRVVGIDEWAWRKGLNYGTIIVDLECQIARNRDPHFARNRDPSAACLSSLGWHLRVLGGLWISGLPERPSRVWRRQATYPRRTA